MAITGRPSRHSARDLLPGALATLEGCAQGQSKIALASASRSAGELVERMGIGEFFDHIVDASTIARAKPDPEIFQQRAAALGVDAADCLGIEDAQAGIAATAAGHGRPGHRRCTDIGEADAVLLDLTSFRLSTLSSRSEISAGHAGSSIDKSERKQLRIENRCSNTILRREYHESPRTSQTGIATAITAALPQMVWAAGQDDLRWQRSPIHRPIARLLPKTAQCRTQRTLNPCRPSW